MPPGPGVVTDVSVNLPMSDLFAGQTVQASAAVEYSGNASADVTWASSDTAVITVTPGGSVTAMDTGTAELTATSAFDPSYSDTVTVTVGTWAWEAMPNLPMGVSRPAGVFADGRFFVIGGEIQGTARVGNTHVFDPVAGTWDTSLPHMPVAASNLCAVELDGGIYALGGSTAATGATDAVRRFDLGSEQWTQLTADPMPSGRQTHACAVHDGRIYVFGGYFSITSPTHYEPWAFDPALPEGERWITGLTAAPELSRYGSAVTVGEYIYYAGFLATHTDYVNHDAALRYDPAADTWERLPSLRTPRASAALWTDGERLFIAGGGWSTQLDSVEVYDLAAGLDGRWVEGGPTLALSTPRRSFASAADPATGTVYLAGGFGGGNYLFSGESGGSP